MKIRNGFVSNSSTSSFCIYGVNLCRIDEELQNNLTESGIEIHYVDSNFYVGKSWSSIKDDETGAQFKDAVEKSIREVINNEEISFRTHEMAWYDG